MEKSVVPLSKNKRRNGPAISVTHDHQARHSNGGRVIVACLLGITLTLMILFPADTVHAQESPLDPVVIQLRWFHQFQFAGYYAAIEKGFYADEGLAVSFREFEPGKDRIAPVLEGKAQYGVGDPALLHLRLQGRPVVVLAQIFQHSPEVLIVRRDSGIFEPLDSVGKRIMIPQDDLGTVSVRMMLIDSLGSLDRISIIPYTFTVDDLADGKVEAMTGYLSNQPFQLRQKGVPVNIIEPRFYGIDFYGDNLFTIEDEVTNHPERVEKMIRATLKGWRYALDHHDEIVDLIIEKYDSELEPDQLHYEAKVIEQMVMPELVEVGEISPRRYRYIAETYQQLGITQSSIVPEGFIYQPGSAPALSLTPGERAWLRVHPDIELGYTDAYPPEIIVNSDGTYSGMVVDFLDALNKKLGTDFGLRIYAIPQLIENAQAKKVDGILSIHPEYAEKLGLLKTRAVLARLPGRICAQGGGF